MSLSVTEFVKRWKINSLSERSGSQSHFIDLCDMVDQPHPAAADATGERFTFDKPLNKIYGGKGFADVWLRDHFAWEYKGRHKDLKAAYKQINDYREDLGNPPLLVVCDLDRFEVHTNFTSTTKRVYAFDLSDLDRNQPTATCPLPPLQVLRCLFDDTNALRPNRTDAFVTQEAAKVFARLAERLEIEKRSHTDSPIHTKEEIAHFLMRLLFCLFADSIGLLPKHLFRNLVRSDDRFLPRKFLRKLKALFEAMSEPDGIFGEHTIKYFNGGLFDSSSIIELDTTDLGILYEVTSNFDWSHVAPEIFGTLFERSLNAKRRSLIGAHYTSAEDILLLIEPVLMRPLERRWADVKSSILTLLHPGIEPGAPGLASETWVPTEPSGAPSSPMAPSSAKVGSQYPSSTTSKPKSLSLLNSNPEAEHLLRAWIDELTAVRVLDPACGSGNFLYLALRRMLDLWLEAQRFAAANDISMVLPKMVSPSQLYGIETEFYAHELASIVVWIGYLQWKHEHGIPDDREPILEKLSNIEHADAILRYNREGKPYEPVWPTADFIIGNPPFLGDKKMRRELDTSEHSTYVDDLRAVYAKRVSGGADLVTYWFEKARFMIESKLAKRAGLLATQSIRAGKNREVLQRIADTEKIFFAYSDRAWLLHGASVRVAMVGFGIEEEGNCELDGGRVLHIHPDLTSEAALTTAKPLRENDGLAFVGTQKGGRFELSSDDAERMLKAPLNPNGKPNSMVVKPWANGRDITHRPAGEYVVDFHALSEQEAALFEYPFQHVVRHVKPKRASLRREGHRTLWWVHAESRPGMRKALVGRPRFIATPRVAKHRLFVWLGSETIPDSRLVVIARSDDYFLGILHSSIHEAWSTAMASWHGVGNDPTYNAESIFMTFPFPYPPGTEPTEADSPIVKAIAGAARELVRLRDVWLNPPNASEADLKDRTLTKLYNARPEWLANAHRTLDTAVFAAYGWPSDLTDQEILSRLLALNHKRAAAQATETAAQPQPIPKSPNLNQ